MLNHAYFVGWMCKLLGALKKNIENTVIIMDNSKYHKQIPYYTPQMGYKKAKLPEKCSKKGIQVPYKSIKTEIWKILSPLLEIICQPSLQWPNMKGMRWFFIYHTTPICSRLRLCGKIIKVKSDGNTPHRKPLRTFLCALINHWQTLRHTKWKSVSSNPTRA